MTRIRIATYNIHKGVQGLGPNRRLEIHNLGVAVEQFDADIVCLQEVRKIHNRGAVHFKHWPEQPQADYLAPEGYHSVYRTNAFTRHGEHGNALLSRWPVLGHQHEDMSDHRFEQRGLLHAEVALDGHHVHVVVVHLGLVRGSRVRQMAQLAAYIANNIPAQAPVVVAGDFNDWGAILTGPMASVGLHNDTGQQIPTFPARLPIVQFDHVFVRGMVPLSHQVPRGRAWWRMSDHLPLIAEFELSGGHN